MIFRVWFAGALILASVSLYAEGQQKNPKTRIGISTALSGAAASWGQDILSVVQFAAEELAPNTYEFVVDDDQCSSKNAVTVANRFVEIEKLRYVIGLSCSSTMPPTAPIYNRAGALVIGVAGSAASISSLNVLRTWPSDDKAARMLAAHIGKKHRRIGVMTELSEYTANMAASFKAGAGELEVSEEVVPEGSIDYRSSLMKLKQRGIEGIFLNNQSIGTAEAAVRQLRQLDQSLPIYAAYWPNTKSMSNAAALFKGAEYVDVVDINSVLSADGARLLAKYRQLHKKPLEFDFVFVTAFEGMRAMHAAISAAAEDKKAWLKQQKFAGLAGPWWFDQHGDIQGIEFVIKRSE